MKHPIPEAALDDRLFFTGIAGTGKTYNAMGRVERLLKRKNRVVISDPLGVWWGLRLAADGSEPSGYDVVIFGGAHGDLPLTEHAGALIGETVAGMQESCILDLSQLPTAAAERRFMLAFLTALYKKTPGEPLHVVFDEADMWAPQRVLDKEGDSNRLLGMMETIVRRGRVKGFIPWLISQRPAVINKNVLSQVDGLIAFGLTSSQDRDAIGDWVEGQADKAQWRQIWSSLPTMERGQGVVWIPRRGILDTTQFPVKETFDSSRTPARGEKAKHTAELKPIDLSKLKERLSKVEAETKANDPKALKAEVARLTGELRKAAASVPQAVDPEAIKKAEERGFEQAKKKISATFERELQATLLRVLGEVHDDVWHFLTKLDGDIKVTKAALPDIQSQVVYTPSVSPAPSLGSARPRPSPTPRARPKASSNGSGVLAAPLQKIIDAIHWWNVMGVAEPSHPQVAFIAGYSHKSGTWSTYLSKLRSEGLIAERGNLALTTEGAALANYPDAAPTGEALRGIVLDKLDGPLRKIMIPILDSYPAGAQHAEIAEKAGYSHQSGTWSTYLSKLRSLDLIEKRGDLRAQYWLFP